MKPFIRFAFVAFAAALLLAGATQAQQKKTTDTKLEERTRGLFVNKTADAMRVIILRDDGNTLVPVSPSHEFVEGDKIKVAFESNFTGYVYLINITPDGKKKVIFPDAENTGNAVRPNQRYEFPPGSAMIQFDDQKGTEVLQVVMSKERVPYLEEAIKNSKGEMGTTGASAAAELQGGITAENVTKVLPEKGAGGVRSREIRFAAGKDKDPEGSVVAISDNTGAGGKLDKGEVAVFEIRLKHN
jgi:hypothetical protein